MREGKWAWLSRSLVGGTAGLLAALILIPYLMDSRLVDPSLIHISQAPRQAEKSYGLFCL